MKYCIGPMSKNVVDSVIDFSNKNDIEIGLIPSRRQIDYFGGYVNNWNTKTFSEYVKNKTNNVKIIRDHGGRNQGSFNDDGIVSFSVDSVLMDGIHIDVWRNNENIEDAIRETVYNICRCLSINEDLFFEIGTEQSIKAYTSDELDYFLNGVKDELGINFSKIKYAVIQCGTSLKSNTNTGTFDQNKLLNMVNVVKKYGLLTKEHNGDYTTKETKDIKFYNGLDCINIAPELGLIETNCILNNMSYVDFEKYFDICFCSNKWKKWVSDEFVPQENKTELIKICGHYNRTNSFVDNFVIEHDLNNVIKFEISSFLESLY